jgi:septum formation protein
MKKLVLASTSAYRRELLARLGVPFESIAPAFDEEAFKDPTLAPIELARLLARRKAESIALERPDAYVLGSDQLVELDGQVLGKPHTEARALAQLTLMVGRAHRLVTAFALLTPEGGCDEHVDLHTLHMRALSRSALVRYVGLDAPYDCAGSYKIESRGIALFERIEGDDFTAIMGLPLVALVTRLRAHGFEVP